VTLRTIMMTALAGLSLVAAPAAAAPVSASSPPPGRALILIPLTLVKTDDLRFGTLIPSALSGTAMINPITGARTVAGGVTAVASDAGQRAGFAGAGSPNQLVVISVTAPANLTSVAGDTLPVLALTLDGPPLRTIDPVTRTFYFGVGGIILINANQPEGLYESTFDVTADYL
jgi:hypothetical protein